MHASLKSSGYERMVLEQKVEALQEQLQVMHNTCVYCGVFI
jgi:hypothetical protein